MTECKIALQLPSFKDVWMCCVRERVCACVCLLVLILLCFGCIGYKYMGGVDTSDLMLSTNSVHHKTKKSYITVFQHFLVIAVTNNYIIYKEQCTSQQQKHESPGLPGRALCEAPRSSTE